MANEGHYFADDLKRIAKEAGVDRLPHYWESYLQEAARNYLVVEWGERDFLLTKKERRRALLRVAEIAKSGGDAELEEAISDLDYEPNSG